MFSLRIVTTDYYLANPLRNLDVCFSDFRGTESKKVPVFRIYGSTPAGQKTCMHVHGVFPYLFVPYDGTKPSDKYIKQFAASVDKALNVALGNAASTSQHVFKISVVSGIPFYGYHPKDQQFLKIYLYNPAMVKRVADLLLGGAVMNKVFQPHEAHVPYSLQLFMDYNLYGMNMINVAAAKFRRPREEKSRTYHHRSSIGSSTPGTPATPGSIMSPGTPGSIMSPGTPSTVLSIAEMHNKSYQMCRWDQENIPSKMLLDAEVQRMSTCELEVDVVAADILNRLEIEGSAGANPGLMALWDDEKERRREKGQSSQIENPQSQDRGTLGSTNSEERWKDRLQEIIVEQQRQLEEELEHVRKVGVNSPGSGKGRSKGGPAKRSRGMSSLGRSGSVETPPRRDSVDSEGSDQTMMLDESFPVVDVDSVHRVVSCSQSFHSSQNPSSQPIMDSQDKALAELLACLTEAPPDSPNMTSNALSQVAALEEQDSILGSNPTGDDKEDDLISKEMTQHFWSDDEGEGQEKKRKKPGRDSPTLDEDLLGMDQSWSGSQWLDIDSVDSVPQYDGAGDENTEKSAPVKKRLGVRGPVLPMETPPAIPHNLTPQSKVTAPNFSNLIDHLPMYTPGPDMPTWPTSPFSLPEPKNSLSQIADKGKNSKDGNLFINVDQESDKVGMQPPASPRTSGNIGPRSPWTPNAGSKNNATKYSMQHSPNPGFNSASGMPASPYAPNSAGVNSPMEVLTNLSVDPFDDSFNSPGRFVPPMSPGPGVSQDGASGYQSHFKRFAEANRTFEADAALIKSSITSGNSPSMQPSASPFPVPHEEYSPQHSSREKGNGSRSRGRGSKSSTRDQNNRDDELAKQNFIALTQNHYQGDPFPSYRSPAESQSRDRSPSTHALGQPSPVPAQSQLSPAPAQGSTEQNYPLEPDPEVFDDSPIRKAWEVAMGTTVDLEQLDLLSGKPTIDKLQQQQLRMPPTPPPPPPQQKEQQLSEKQQKHKTVISRLETYVNSKDTVRKYTKSGKERKSKTRDKSSSAQNSRNAQLPPVNHPGHHPGFHPGHHPGGHQFPYGPRGPGHMNPMAQNNFPMPMQMGPNMGHNMPHSPGPHNMPMPMPMHMSGHNLPHSLRHGMPGTMGHGIPNQMGRGPPPSPMGHMPMGHNIPSPMGHNIPNSMGMNMPSSMGHNMPPGSNGMPPMGMNIPPSMGHNIPPGMGPMPTSMAQNIPMTFPQQPVTSHQNLPQLGLPPMNQQPFNQRDSISFSQHQGNVPHHHGNSSIQPPPPPPFSPAQPHSFTQMMAHHDFSLLSPTDATSSNNFNPSFNQGTSSQNNFPQSVRNNQLTEPQRNYVPSNLGKDLQVQSHSIIDDCLPELDMDEDDLPDITPRDQGTPKNQGLFLAKELVPVKEPAKSKEQNIGRVGGNSSSHDMSSTKGISCDHGMQSSHGLPGKSKSMDQNVPKDALMSREEGMLRDLNISRVPALHRDQDMSRSKGMSSGQPVSSNRDVPRDQGASRNQDVLRDQGMSRDSALPRGQGTSSSNRNLQDQDRGMLQRTYKDQDMLRGERVPRDQGISRGEAVLNDQRLESDQGMLRDQETLQDQIISTNQEIPSEQYSSREQGLSKNMDIARDRDIIRDTGSVRDQVMSRDIVKYGNYDVSKNMDLSSNHSMPRNQEKMLDKEFTREPAMRRDTDFSSQVHSRLPTTHNVERGSFCSPEEDSRNQSYAREDRDRHSSQLVHTENQEKTYPRLTQQLREPQQQRTPYRPMQDDDELPRGLRTSQNDAVTCQTTDRVPQKRVTSAERQAELQVLLRETDALSVEENAELLMAANTATRPSTGTVPVSTEMTRLPAKSLNIRHRTDAVPVSRGPLNSGIKQNLEPQGMIDSAALEIRERTLKAKEEIRLHEIRERNLLAEMNVNRKKREKKKEARQKESSESEDDNDDDDCDFISLRDEGFSARQTKSRRERELSIQDRREALGTSRHTERDPAREIHRDYSKRPERELSTRHLDRDRYEYDREPLPRDLVPRERQRQVISRGHSREILIDPDFMDYEGDLPSREDEMRGLERPLTSRKQQYIVFDRDSPPRTYIRQPSPRRSPVQKIASNRFQNPMMPEPKEETRKTAKSKQDKGVKSKAYGKSHLKYSSASHSYGSAQALENDDEDDDEDDDDCQLIIDYEAANHKKFTKKRRQTYFHTNKSPISQTIDDVVERAMTTGSAKSTFSAPATTQVSVRGQAKSKKGGRGRGRAKSKGRSKSKSKSPGKGKSRASAGRGGSTTNASSTMSSNDKRKSQQKSFSELLEELEKQTGGVCGPTCTTVAPVHIGYATNCNNYGYSGQGYTSFRGYGHHWKHPSSVTDGFNGSPASSDDLPMFNSKGTQKTYMREWRDHDSEVKYDALVRKNTLSVPADYSDNDADYIDNTGCDDLLPDLYNQPKPNKKRSQLSDMLLNRSYASKLNSTKKSPSKLRMKSKNPLPTCRLKGKKSYYSSGMAVQYDGLASHEPAFVPCPSFVDVPSSPEHDYGLYKPPVNRHSKLSLKKRKSEGDLYSRASDDSQDENTWNSFDNYEDSTVPKSPCKLVLSKSSADGKWKVDSLDLVDDCKINSKSKSNPSSPKKTIGSQFSLFPWMKGYKPTATKFKNPNFDLKSVGQVHKKVFKPNETVLFSSESVVNYYQGRATNSIERKTRKMDSVRHVVKVTTKDKERYDFSKIGKERVMVKKLPKRLLRHYLNKDLSTPRRTSTSSKNYAALNNTNWTKIYPPSNAAYSSQMNTDQDQFSSHMNQVDRDSDPSYSQLCSSSNAQDHSYKDRDSDREIGYDGYDDNMYFEEEPEVIQDIPVQEPQHPHKKVVLNAQQRRDRYYEDDEWSPSHELVGATRQPSTSGKTSKSHTTHNRNHDIDLENDNDNSPSLSHPTTCSQSRLDTDDRLVYSQCNRQSSPAYSRTNQGNIIQDRHDADYRLANLRHPKPRPQPLNLSPPNYGEDDDVIITDINLAMASPPLETNYSRNQNEFVDDHDIERARGSQGHKHQRDYREYETGQFEDYEEGKRRRARNSLLNLVESEGSVTPPHMATLDDVYIDIASVESHSDNDDITERYKDVLGDKELAVSSYKLEDCYPEVFGEAVNVEEINSEKAVLCRENDGEIQLKVVDRKSIVDEDEVGESESPPLYRGFLDLMNADKRQFSDSLRKQKKSQPSPRKQPLEFVETLKRNSSSSSSVVELFSEAGDSTAESRQSQQRSQNTPSGNSQGNHPNQRVKKVQKSLNALHDATVEGLNGTEQYSDLTDDFKGLYSDVMCKFALYSPPPSEIGENSPPMPLSPEQIDTDQEEDVVVVEKGRKRLGSDFSTRLVLSSVSTEDQFNSPEPRQHQFRQPLGVRHLKLQKPRERNTPETQKDGYTEGWIESSQNHLGNERRGPPELTQENFIEMSPPRLGPPMNEDYFGHSDNSMSPPLLVKHGSPRIMDEPLALRSRENRKAQRSHDDGRFMDAEANDVEEGASQICSTLNGSIDLFKDSDASLILNPDEQDLVLDEIVKLATDSPLPCRITNVVSYAQKKELFLDEGEVPEMDPPDLEMECIQVDVCKAETNENEMVVAESPVLVTYDEDHDNLEIQSTTTENIMVKPSKTVVEKCRIASRYWLKHRSDSIESYASDQVTVASQVPTSEAGIESVPSPAPLMADHDQELPSTEVKPAREAVNYWLQREHSLSAASDPDSLVEISAPKQRIPFEDINDLKESMTGNVKEETTEMARESIDECISASESIHDDGEKPVGDPVQNMDELSNASTGCFSEGPFDAPPKKEHCVDDDLPSEEDSRSGSDRSSVKSGRSSYECQKSSMGFDSHQITRKQHTDDHDDDDDVFVKCNTKSKRKEERTSSVESSDSNKSKVWKDINDLSDDEATTTNPDGPQYRLDLHSVSESSKQAAQSEDSCDKSDGRERFLSEEDERDNSILSTIASDSSHELENFDQCLLRLESLQATLEKVGLDNRVSPSPRPLPIQTHHSITETTSLLKKLESADSGYPQKVLPPIRESETEEQSEDSEQFESEEDQSSDTDSSDAEEKNSLTQDIAIPTPKPPMPIDMNEFERSEEEVRENDITMSTIIAPTPQPPTPFEMDHDLIGDDELLEIDVDAQAVRADQRPNQTLDERGLEIKETNTLIESASNAESDTEESANIYSESYQNDRPIAPVAIPANPIYREDFDDSQQNPDSEFEESPIPATFRDVPYPSALRVPLVVSTNNFNDEEREMDSTHIMTSPEQQREDTAMSSKIRRPKPVPGTPIHDSEDYIIEQCSPIISEEDVEGDPTSSMEDDSERSDDSSDEAYKDNQTSDPSVRSPYLIAPVPVPATPADLTVVSNSTDVEPENKPNRADNVLASEDEDSHREPSSLDEASAHRDCTSVTTESSRSLVHPPTASPFSLPHPRSHEDEANLADDEMSIFTSCRSELHHSGVGLPGLRHDMYSLKDLRKLRMSVADEDELSVYIEDNHGSPPSDEENRIVCPIPGPPGRITQLESIDSMTMSEEGNDRSVEAALIEENATPNLVCPIPGPPRKNHFAGRFSASSVTDEVSVNISDETENDAAFDDESEEHDHHGEHAVMDLVNARADLSPGADHTGQLRHELPPNLVQPKAGPPGSVHSQYFPDDFSSSGSECAEDETHSVASEMDEKESIPAEDNCTPVIPKTEIPSEEDDEYYDVPTPTMDEPLTPASCDIPLQDAYLSPVSVYKSRLLSAGDYSQLTSSADCTIDKHESDDDTSKGAFSSQESGDCLTYEVKHTQSGIVVMPRVDENTDLESNPNSEEMSNIQDHHTGSPKRVRMSSCSSYASSVEVIIHERHRRHSDDSENSYEEMTEEEEDDEEVIRQEEKCKHDAWLAAERQNTEMGKSREGDQTSDEPNGKDTESDCPENDEAIGALNPSDQTGLPEETTSDDQESEEPCQLPELCSPEEDIESVRSRLTSQGFDVKNIVEVESPTASQQVLEEQAILTTEESAECVWEVMQSETQEFEVSNALLSESDTTDDTEFAANSQNNVISSPKHGQTVQGVVEENYLMIDAGQPTSNVTEVEMMNSQDEPSLTLGQRFNESVTNLDPADYMAPTPGLGVVEVEIESFQEGQVLDLEPEVDEEETYPDSPSDESEDEMSAQVLELEIAEVEVEDSDTPILIKDSEDKSDKTTHFDESSSHATEVELTDSKSPLKKPLITAEQDRTVNEEGTAFHSLEDKTLPDTPSQAFTEDPGNESLSKPSLTLGQEVHESQSDMESEGDELDLLLPSNSVNAEEDEDDHMQGVEVEEEQEATDAKDSGSDADVSDTESTSSVIHDLKVKESLELKGKPSSSDSSEGDNLASLTPGQGHLNQDKEGQHSSSDTSDGEDMASLTPGQDHSHRPKEDQHYTSDTTDDDMASLTPSQYHLHQDSENQHHVSDSAEDEEMVSLIPDESNLFKEEECVTSPVMSVLVHDVVEHKSEHCSSDTSEDEDIALLTLGQGHLRQEEESVMSPVIPAIVHDGLGLIGKYSSSDSSENEEMLSPTPGEGQLLQDKEGSVSPVIPVLHDGLAPKSDPSSSDSSEDEDVASLTPGRGHFSQDNRGPMSPAMPVLVDDSKLSSSDSSGDEDIGSLTAGQGHFNHKKDDPMSPVMPVLDVRPPTPAQVGDPQGDCDSPDQSPIIPNLNHSDANPRSPEIPHLDPLVCLDEYDVISSPFNPRHHHDHYEDKKVEDNDKKTSLTNSPELPNYDNAVEEYQSVQQNGDMSPVLPNMDKNFESGSQSEEFIDDQSYMLKTQGKECISTVKCADKTTDDVTDLSECSEKMGKINQVSSSVWNVKDKTQEVRQYQVSKKDYKAQDDIYASCGMMDVDSPSSVDISHEQMSPLQKSILNESNNFTKSYYDSQVSLFSSIHSARQHTQDIKCDVTDNRRTPERPISRRNSATRASPTAAELLSARMDIEDEDSEIDSDEEIDVVGIDDEEDVFYGEKMEEQPNELRLAADEKLTNIQAIKSASTEQENHEPIDTFTGYPSETTNEEIERFLNEQSQDLTGTPERSNTPEPESDMINAAVFPKQGKNGQCEQTSDLTKTPERSRSNTPDSDTSFVPSPNVNDENLRNKKDDPIEYEVRVIKIMTPILPPPTRKQVIADMKTMAYSGHRHKEPFYSNKADVPANIMDVGGRILKVKANSISQLKEFENVNPFNANGLKDWQVMLAGGIDDMNEDNGFSIMMEIEKNPQLKASIMGNDKIIMTPCKLPPSTNNVKLWLEEKILERKTAQKARIVKARETMDHENDVVRELSYGDYRDEMEPEILADKIAEEDTDEETGERRYLKPQRRVSFTRDALTQMADMEVQDITKGDVLPSSQGEVSNTMEVEKDVIESSQTEGSLVKVVHLKRTRSVDLVVKQEERVEKEIISPPPKCRRLSRWDQSSPAYRRTRSEEDVPHHSTPIRRAFSDMPCPGYTPILGREMDVAADLVPLRDAAVENKPRPCLKRRHSSDSLRKAVLESQVKTLFGTPKRRLSNMSMIEGPTPPNTCGFKVSQHDLKDAKAVHERQYLTVLSIELHCHTRGDLRPNPEFDSICGIFYHLYDETVENVQERERSGVFILDDAASATTAAGPSTSTASPKRMTPRRPPLTRSGIWNLEASYFSSENELLEAFVEFIVKLDPDILVGYEIQMVSWGYLLQRGANLNMNVCAGISRLPDNPKESTFSSTRDEYGADHNSEIHIAGRIVLNLWRLLRHEVTLNIYTFENVAYHVLHERIPLFTHQTLTKWFNHKTDLYRWRTVEHYAFRAKANIRILNQLDLIGRTSEFARIFGIEFYDVLSRGSQYRVESMMLRMAKPMNYIAASPGVQQRARQKAPEIIALTMEPESRFYSDPVVLLDFQSLYPSIMIAYNYCYSTCLGRVENIANAESGEYEFGCSSLRMSHRTLKRLDDDVFISPVGVAFVKQETRKGTMPKMVEDILNTRIMVKKTMKESKDEHALKRILDARQMGLKLIANVTYGYTAASFSGRMPCVEVADSIVSKARETLERAIKLVEENEEWGAQVVYGDTDSMFILLKGRSKDDAFRIGYEMCDAVTKDNPKPIKLKFEKVYMPCLLQTKKRYVGYAYETQDQQEPVYDAKGIETVRRDSCPTVSKILEKSLKVLFTTKDVSQVKQYVQRQCRKLMEGRIPIQDLTFAKEYRGIPGYKPTACVPALEIAKKSLAVDQRSEPRVGERVPYVVVYGQPGLPLIQLIRQPMEVLQDPSLRLNAIYYITKQVLPPLDRAFSLMGVDVFSWYHEMPKVMRLVPTSHFQDENRQGTLSKYFSTMNCPVCDEMTNQGLCDKCKENPQTSAIVINDRIRHWERSHQHLSQICYSCMGSNDPKLGCISLDCPILYQFVKVTRDLTQSQKLREIQQHLDF